MSLFPPSANRGLRINRREELSSDGLALISHRHDPTPLVLLFPERVLVPLRLARYVVHTRRQHSPLTYFSGDAAIAPTSMRRTGARAQPSHPKLYRENGESATTLKIDGLNSP